MSSSQTNPDHLKAFDWLPLERWTPDSILCDFQVEGKRNCKVCDKWIPRSEEESHVAKHVREVKVLKKKAKDEAAKKRDAARKAAQKERSAMKGTPADPSPAPRKKRASKSKASVEQVSTLKAALKNSGSATVASLAETTGIDIAVVRNTIKSIDEAVVVGHHRSGGRGRPAIIYGWQNNTTKEG